MIRTRVLPLALLLTISSACTVVDVRDDEGRIGVRSDGLIDGFATVGWANDPSFLRAELLDGRSDGALALLDLWYLARVEVGAAGASVGVGPFDVGIGTLFYEPRSPAARSGSGHSGHSAHSSDAWPCDCEDVVTTKTTTASTSSSPDE